MTRELSEQEKEARFEAWDKYLIANGVSVTIGERRAFDTGFIAGLDYQQARIEELVAALVQIANGLPSVSSGKSELWLSPSEMAEVARAAAAKVRGQ